MRKVFASQRILANRGPGHSLQTIVQFAEVYMQCKKLRYPLEFVVSNYKNGQVDYRCRCKKFYAAGNRYTVFRIRVEQSSVQDLGP